MQKRISGINLVAGVAIVATAGIFGCKTDTPAASTHTDPDDTLGPCDFDKDNDVPDGAETLTLDEATEGFICPVGDQDWFSVTVPDGKNLLKIELSQAGPFESINPVYTVFEEDATTSVGAPDATESATENTPLTVVHKISAGKYFVRVLDQANDALDKFHPYTLTVFALADPDTNEPNDAADAATALSTGDMNGYLSYRGDEDWFNIDSPARRLLTVSMAMENGVAPAYRIVNSAGEIVVDRKNDKGVSSYSYFDSLAEAGVYSLVVYFDDPLRFDTEVPYTLNAVIEADPDTHEGNDTPEEATLLTTSPIACGATWSDWTETTGYIASSGDIDWYRVDVSGSEKGILEAEVVFDNPSALPKGLDPSIRFIYGVPGNPCTTHQQCQSLTTTCTEDIECSKIGNNCLNTGMCAGSGVCMPGGNCGATLLAVTSAAEMTSNPDVQPTNAPRGTVRAAAPLFGITTMYVAVEDYQGDTQSATAPYTIRVRVADDSDTHEPSEMYTNHPALENDSVWPHLDFATSVPVHACVGTAATDCCGDGTWIEGAISYTYDQDWYYYDNPCAADQDCMVRIHYQVDAGPVDALMMLYVDGSLWYDTIIPSVSDEGDQAAKSGVCGGLAATDSCLYAYHSYDGYYFTVRDTNYVSGGNLDNGTWDWNRDQRYRFCVEKIADQCQAPCKIYENTANPGCGPEEGK